MDPTGWRLPAMNYGKTALHSVRSPGAAWGHQVDSKSPGRLEGEVQIVGSKGRWRPEPSQGAGLGSAWTGAPLGPWALGAPSDPTILPGMDLTPRLVLGCVLRAGGLIPRSPGLCGSFFTRGPSGAP